MNNLVVPPSPNWYEPSVTTCAEDNTLIYGSRNDLVIVEPTSENEAANVNIISRAHSHKIISVNINKNWGSPHKLAVTVGEDKAVRIWNLETYEKKLSHNEHAKHERVVGATFAGDDRVISVEENGSIVVWNLGLNTCNILTDVFGFRVCITCISTCPHASWLTAFGLRSGLLVITDLRKNGKVLYKLRGHDKPVLSLSWCPAPVNIFPVNPRNKVVNKKLYTEKENKSCHNIKGEEQHTITVTENCTTKNICTDLCGPLGENISSIGQALKKTDNSDLGYIDTKLCVVSEKHIPDNIIDNAGIEVPNSSVEVEENQVLFNTSDTTNEVVQDFTKKHSGQTEIEKTSDANSSDEPKKKVNPWINLIFDDDDDVPQSSEGDHTEIRPVTDFLEECEVLKNKILSTEVEFSSSIEIKMAHHINDTTKISIENVQTDSKSPKDENVVENSSAHSLSSLHENTSDVSSHIETEVSMNASKNNSNTDRNCLKLDDNDKLELDDNTQQSDLKLSTHIESSLPINDNESNTANESILKLDNNKSDETNTQEGNSKAKEDTKRYISKEEYEKPRKEFLLASSSRESNIYIWRAGTDGRMQTFLTLPGKNRRNLKTPDKTWISLCWASPHNLLTSSRNNELLQWTLPKPEDSKSQFRIIHHDHFSLLFNIVAPVKQYNEYNFDKVGDLNAWTIGQDRLVLNTSLGAERTNLACYPTIGGPISCLMSSVLDPNKLAIGTGDGSLKIWDLSRPHTKNIVMTRFYQKIQSKVTSLAWHPTVEKFLAYGTLEGRVGYLDVCSPSKPPILLPHYFKSEIHNIEWAPYNNNKDDMRLYVIAEGKLMVFDTNKSNDPVEVDTPDKTFAYMFAWKPDYSIMLLSTKSGTLIVYSSDLNILQTCYVQQKYENILWHPEAIRSDTSSYSNSFAVYSNSKSFKICTLVKEIKEGAPLFDLSVMATLEGHVERVNSVSWCLFDKERIVSVGEDGFAQVWDIQSKSIIAQYASMNFEGILCAMWSPVDPDCIIIGGKSNTLSVWRVSENPCLNHEGMIEKRKHFIKNVRGETTLNLPKEVVQKEEKKPKVSAKHSVLPAFNAARDVSQQICDMKRLLSLNENNETQSLKNGETDNFESNIVKIFGPNSGMRELVNKNSDVLKKRGKYALNSMLCMMKGDISDAIADAIKEKRVDTFILAMAPMVSPQLWQEACLTYATQLSDHSDTDPLETACYYLACHKVKEAINVLTDNLMMREALALAKCRLPDNDPLIAEIVDKWALHSAMTGNFEVAAQCYISQGKYEEAASILFRRSDEETLKFASELAEKLENRELYNAIMFRCNAFKSSSENNKSDETITVGEAESTSNNDQIPTHEILTNTGSQPKEEVKHLESAQDKTMKESDMDKTCSSTGDSIKEGIVDIGKDTNKNKSLETFTGQNVENTATDKGIEGVEIRSGADSAQDNSVGFDKIQIGSEINQIEYNEKNCNISESLKKCGVGDTEELQCSEIQILAEDMSQNDKNSISNEEMIKEKALINAETRTTSNLGASLAALTSESGDFCDKLNVSAVETSIAIEVQKNNDAEIVEE